MGCRAEGLEAQEPQGRSSLRAFLKLLELSGRRGPDLGARGGPSDCGSVLSATQAAGALGGP